MIGIEYRNETKFYAYVSCSLLHTESLITLIMKQGKLQKKYSESHAFHSIHSQHTYINFTVLMCFYHDKLNLLFKNTWNDSKENLTQTCKFIICTGSSCQLIDVQLLLKSWLVDCEMYFKLARNLQYCKNMTELNV